MRRILQPKPTVDAIMAKLDDQWRTTAQVAELVGNRSVRIALNQLADSGDIEKREVKTPGRRSWMEWRALQ